MQVVRLNSVINYIAYIFLNLVGLAIAERNMSASFNKEGFSIVDHFTFVICGDGCLQV
jgi:transketolase